MPFQCTLDQTQWLHLQLLHFQFAMTFYHVFYTNKYQKLDNLPTLGFLPLFLLFANNKILILTNNVSVPQLKLDMATLTRRARI